MLDLRKYNAQIREHVTAENEKDENWKWSVKSIGKSLVRIRWEYLDYMEEKENCFLLALETDDSGSWLYARQPHGELIDCYSIVEGEPNRRMVAEMTIAEGIRAAIEEIAYYAHNYY